MATSAEPPDPSPATPPPEPPAQKTAPPDAPAGPRDEAVSVKAEADGAASTDAMGFTPYVNALAHFLRGSKGGLTVSIEGKWGGGKSSFMRQLADTLRAEAVIVPFNPWHHEDPKTLGAAFAKQFVEQARADRERQARERGIEERLKERVERARRRAAASSGPAAKTPFAVRRDEAVLALARRARGTRLGRRLASRLADRRAKIVLAAVEESLEAYQRKDAKLVLRRAAPWAAGVALMLALCAVTLMGYVPPPDWIDQIGGVEVTGAAEAAVTFGGGAAAAFLRGVVRVRQAVEDPVSRVLDREASKRDPQNEVVGKVQGDLADVVKRYVGAKRVYVFVDDLDRCDPRRMADVLLAVNRIIEGANQAQADMVFLLGMDREKVAAGLAVSHREVLEFLGEEAEGDETTADRDRRMRRSGIRYGQDFIEKFVQIPFSIPQPSSPEVQGYLRSLTASDADAAAEGVAAAKAAAGDEAAKHVEKESATPKGDSEPAVSIFREVVRILRGTTAGEAPVAGAGAAPDAGAVGAAAAQEPKGTGSEASEAIRVRLGEDSRAIAEIFALLAPAMGNNPRRLKYALNLFRLRAYIAAETKLFDRDQDRAPLTFEQLAKIVVINVQWPDLLAELERAPRLLADVEAVVLQREWQTVTPPEPPADERVRRWADEEDLAALLRAGVIPTRGLLTLQSASQKSEDWRLGNAPYELLLKTIPKGRSLERVTKTPKQVAEGREGAGEGELTEASSSTPEEADSWASFHGTAVVRREAIQEGIRPILKEFYRNPTAFDAITLETAEFTLDFTPWREAMKMRLRPLDASLMPRSVFGDHALMMGFKHTGDGWDQLAPSSAEAAIALVSDTLHTFKSRLTPRQPFVILRVRRREPGAHPTTQPFK